MTTTTQAIGEPLLELDRKALLAFRPYRRTMPVRALAAACKVADQPEMRAWCGGLIVVGLARRDGRMARAGIKMILAHELANAIKLQLKKRVERRRPRNEARDTPAKPHEGRSVQKPVTSFPSGHSGGAMAAAVAFGSVYPGHAAAARGTAVLLGLSRIPPGAHYPSDVAAGLALGAGAGKLVNWASRRLAGLFRMRT